METKTETPKRELNYVMVRHLAYDRAHKMHRAERAGGRRRRFMLDDGTNIRPKGSRMTEVSLDTLAKNLNKFLEGVRNGVVEVCRPDNLQALTLEQLGDLGERLLEDYRVDLKVDRTLLEPLFGSDLKDKRVYVETPPADEEHEPLTEPLVPEGTVEFKVEPAVLPEPDFEEPADEITSPDLGQGAVLAAVDQHEAEAKGEANPPPAEVETPAAGPQAEEKVLTEADVRKMNVQELKKLAGDLEIDVSKLKKKDELVEAILATSKE